MAAEDIGTESLISHLKSVLLDLNAHPYPDVANPPEAPRRASVALILRIQPHYSHWPATHDKPFPIHHPYPPSPTEQRRRSSVAEQSGPKDVAFKDILETFFAQDWVQHGDPELLFIKRASRVGDKWTGHVALPGGKRDPEDEDDQATAAREAFEEVGIDLSYNNAITVGNLPQRVVTSSWGKVPLMVLCPYIYLLTSPTYPPQRLQPTEVSSTHWVPLRALQSPHLRTHETADVSSRLAKSELGLKRAFLQSMLSKMLFAAIRLVPSNSTYCATIPGFVPEEDTSGGGGGVFRNVVDALGISGAAHGYAALPPPLKLWGLTLGVVSDLLEHLPPHNAVELWTYPTFTNWDVRFAVWALSYQFRKQKEREMSTQIEYSSEGDDERRPGEVGIAGLGVGRGGAAWGKKGRAKMVARGSAVNSMLEGYYPIVRRAVALALVCRVGVVAGVAVVLLRRFRGGEWVKSLVSSLKR